MSTDGPTVQEVNALNDVLAGRQDQPNQSGYDGSALAAFYASRAPQQPSRDQLAAALMGGSFGRPSFGFQQQAQANPYAQLLAARRAGMGVGGGGGYGFGLGAGNPYLQAMSAQQAAGGGGGGGGGYWRQVQMMSGSPTDSAGSYYEWTPGGDQGGYGAGDGSGVGDGSGIGGGGGGGGSVGGGGGGGGGGGSHGGGGGGGYSSAPGTGPGAAPASGVVGNSSISFGQGAMGVVGPNTGDMGPSVAPGFAGGFSTTAGPFGGANANGLNDGFGMW